jgi:basic membrane protein A
MTTTPTRAPLLVGLAIVVAVLAGCGGADATPTPAPVTSPSPSPQSPAPSATPTTDACAGERIRVGLVTDGGSVEDQAFNQAAWEGIVRAEAEGCVDGDYVESESQDAFVGNIAAYADEGYDVVVGVGILMSDALGDAAKLYPDTRFIAIDGIPGTGHDESWNTNGLSIFFAEDQAGYLAGSLAGQLTGTGTIGVVAGILIPPIERYVEGYIDGAKAVRPDITVLWEYIPSFTDPESGRAAAVRMIERGADIVFSAGGTTGDGAIVAACQREQRVIGVNVDQYNTLPEAQACLLSSAVKNVSSALFQALEAVAGGSFRAGVTVGDARTDSIGLAPYHDLADEVPQAVTDKLAEAYKGLADGSIKPGVVLDGVTE